VCLYPLDHQVLLWQGERARALGSAAACERGCVPGDPDRALEVWAALRSSTCACLSSFAALLYTRRNAKIFFLRSRMHLASRIAFRAVLPRMLPRARFQYCCFMGIDRLAAAAAAATVASAAAGVAAVSCSAAQPHEAIAGTRSTLRKELQRLHVDDAEADALMSRVTIALKGGRVCVSVKVHSDVLPALMPLLRSFPYVTWSAEAGSALGGESLVLRDSAQPRAPDATGTIPPLLSIFVPSGAAAAAEIEVIGGGVNGGDVYCSLTPTDLRALAEALCVAGRSGGAAVRSGDLFTELFGSRLPGAQWDEHDAPQPPRGRGGPFRSEAGGGGNRGPSRGSSGPVERLEALGIRVILPRKEGDASGRKQASGASEQPPGGARGMEEEKEEEEDWTALAGSGGVRAALEESLVLPLSHPRVYEEVMEGTRTRKQVAPHAKSILFEGPPGCGKTSTARILAAQLGRPFVPLPLESLVSKWYGEAEQRLASVFDACAEMGPTVIFLDEIDALATSRDSVSGMHEATRRSLSVLLRRLDGFDANLSTVLVAATNRPQDLDAALLSRFELVVNFPLPDMPNREAILALYAKHLRSDHRARLAAASDGASGRDLRDICEAAERKWAARRVREEAATRGRPLPPVSEYEEALRQRQSHRAPAAA
jgi:MoxR-like ATPase